ncbi:TIGR03899 family protein [Shewanella avicenniae]|uniref:TIGR03899 family protein n=1 Tax=Shewanella avicenniae TaxID=2814294 RepID=A0ABX7QUS3_9GAMM|nr:TIGR03899 family protein [Shewanella avicenniae]QSX34388.1 TIGR03899 family protein [Shewanella avicenniae]
MSDNGKTLEHTAQVQNHTEMSARKKVLRLGRLLGLASEAEYLPANASVLERAEMRLRKQLEQYQRNLENIYAMTLSYTPSDVAGVDLDADWTHQFFSMAEQIHNHTMQDLWARILASEIVQPGNFSLRTLETLTKLTLKESHILEKALGMAVKINQESRLKLISGYRVSGGLGHYFRKQNHVNLGLSNFGLPYSNLLTLVDAGLLHRGEFETGLLAAQTPLELHFPHNTVTVKPKSGYLLFNYYRLSPVGEELAALVTPKIDDAYLSAMRAMFAKDFTIS